MHVAVVALLALVPAVAGLMCHSHHVFMEDDHQFAILQSTCHTNDFCAKVTYKDVKDPRKKNGFSLGCDQTDCDASTNPLTRYQWKELHKGYWCKRNSKSYGSHGQICCCNYHLCNGHHSGAPASASLFLVTLSGLLSFLLLW